MLILGAGVAWGIYSLRGKLLVTPLLSPPKFCRVRSRSCTLRSLISREHVDFAGIGYA